jgi:hypothetical protein
LHFLFDEYLSPELAVIAGGLCLDVRSVHEIGRTGYDDESQLRFAASEGCIFVTRNRDDFIALTKIFYATNQAHHGVLLVPRSLPNQQTKPGNRSRAGTLAGTLPWGGSRAWLC